MDPYYFQQLYEQVQHQQKQLEYLKTSLDKLNTELIQLKEKPSIVVEKLDYKFDQLKVETLEGTLNIGLNPSDLEGIEDMSLPPKRHSDHMQLKEQLLKRVNQYLDENVDSVVEETEKKLNKKLDIQYRNLIKEDIQKQLPARVDHYIQQSIHHSNREQTEKQHLDNIYQQIIGDINQGIYAFISQVPQGQDRKDH